jgi:hypothetical protein
MAVQKTLGESSLAEVIDRILDKGIVVNVWARVSLVGIECTSSDPLRQVGSFGNEQLGIVRASGGPQVCCPS